MPLILRFFYLVTLISVLGSTSTPANYNPFAKYSKVERDSISKTMDDFANIMSQPSEIHRLYKDSAYMLSPENIEIKAHLTYSFKKRGDHLKAMAGLNDVVNKDIKKGSHEQLMYRAWTLIYFYRDYHGTIRDVDLINKMSKRAYNSCWGEPCGLLKGQALYKLGKYEEAIKVFDTVLVEEKKLGFNTDHNFLVHFYKGRCFHSLNDFSNALKSYGLVLQLDPNYTEALYQVGLIYKSKGENALALQNLTKAKEWLKKGKKMGEPYFERFDEVFEYQIDEAIVGLN